MHGTRSVLTGRKSRGRMMMRRRRKRRTGMGGRREEMWMERGTEGEGERKTEKVLGK